MNQAEATKQEGLAVAEFRNELMQGNFDGAKVIERERSIPPQAVNSVISSVFEAFIQEERFADAINIGKKYNLAKDKIADAIYMEFRKINASGNFEKAIEWAMVYNLPDYEITRAAIKGIETAILEGNIEQAVEIKKKYHIEEDQIGNVWQKGYDNAVQRNDYMAAALLSREFGMSERKTIITASRAFRRALKQKDFKTLVQVEEEFRLFNDEGFALLSEEDGRSLIKETESFLREHFRNNNFRDAVETVHGLGILFKELKNHNIRDLYHFLYNQAIEVHGMLLHDNRYDDARWFYHEFNLGEENTPDKIRREIFNQALNYHNRLLSNGSISAALKVKDDYELLGSYSNRESIDQIQDSALTVLGQLVEKGDNQAGNNLIKEYNIPHDDIENVLRDTVVNALNQNKFEAAMDIIEKFKVSVEDYDVKMAARRGFDHCKKSGYYETAANLGYVFGLEPELVQKVAFIVWEELMNRQEYRRAGSVNRKYKLPKKMTTRIAKSEYDRMIQTNDVDKAKKLRDEYQVNVSIFTWIIEIIKKIILLFFGGGRSDEAALGMEAAAPVKEPGKKKFTSPKKEDTPEELPTETPEEQEQ